MDIRICSICNGTGEILEDVGTHSSEWECHKCSSCNGTGRIKSISYNLNVPFNMDETKIYEVDTKIHTLIRSLKLN